VRESLFARLGDLAGNHVLDLFAGSGALGFEALSRGATRVVFADRSRAALATVRRNAEALGVAGAVELQHGEAGAVLGRLAGKSCFDLAFLDPPYASDRLAATLRELAGGALLAPDAVVVAESDRRHPPGAIEGLAAVDERRYGDTLITWFVPRGSTAATIHAAEASDA
jgi:16S rRNA (guanine966-N2)-methyltransferase